MTYNNFDFRGHQRWADYKDIYAAWSKRLHIDKIAMLGGEPFVSPDFPDWLDGIAEFWPNTEIEIISNGTQLKRHPEIYKKLEKYKGRVYLVISSHGIIQKNKTCEELKTWMDGEVKLVNVARENEIDLWLQSYRQIKDATWPDCACPEDFLNLPSNIQEECISVHNFDYHNWYKNLSRTLAINDRGVTVTIHLRNAFTPNALVYNAETNKVSLRNSDPKAAYEVCCGRGPTPTSFIHQFNKGRLSKCSAVGTLPEFLEQFEMDISEADKDLIKKYKPCTIDASDQELEDFVNDLKKDMPIEQCKFCQDTLATYAPFEASVKKIKLYRRSALSSIG
jgi:hypothetical protein